MIFVFFAKGIVVGAVIAVPVGPVGILCLRRTVFEGRSAGLAAGLGAATGDALFGIIAGFGLGFVSQGLIGYEGPLRAAGGCYLVYLGARAFCQVPAAAPDHQIGTQSLFRGFVSTFALTITNPITIVAFLGIFAALGLTGDARFVLATMLVFGVWIGSLLWWLALVFVIGMFRRSMGPRQLGWVAYSSGAILFLSGAALLATTVLKYLAWLL